MEARTAGGSFIDDDLTQVLDAVFGEGGHAILTHAVDPEAAVFGEHVDRQLVQPVFVLAEQVCDVAEIIPPSMPMDTRRYISMSANDDRAHGKKS